MNWEKLIISPKSSQLIKEKLKVINNININININKNEVKYIGVIPIYWDTLGIYYKNQKENEILKIYTEKNLEKDFQKMNLEDEDINEDTYNGIKNIYTKKSQLIVSREFYYLENKDKDKDKNESYYPVFEFSNDLSFTLREIKNQIRSWLLKEGFIIPDDINEFDIFRIYKMNSFHIFSVILPNKSDVNKLKGYWKSNPSLELLPLINDEITNPFMKISQLKHYYNINYGTISNIWLRTLEGYLLKEKEKEKEKENLNLNNEINIIPYKMKWEEILATLANLIDLECNENLKLYFIPRIQDVKKQKINFK